MKTQNLKAAIRRSFIGLSIVTMGASSLISCDFFKPKSEVTPVESVEGEPTNAIEPVSNTPTTAPEVKVEEKTPTVEAKKEEIKPNDLKKNETEKIESKEIIKK